MAIRVQARRFAEQAGLNLSLFQRKTGLSLGTARRMWYSTSNGKEHGPSLKQVNLDVIEQIADYFQVAPGELFSKEV